jgi:hypothetical protein
VVCASSRDVGLDLAGDAAAFARELGGSGGGRGGFAQLKVDPARVGELMERLAAHVRARLLA